MDSIIIPPNRFYIENDIATELIKKYNIQYLRFVYIRDIDGRIVLIAKKLNNNEIPSNRSWMKIKGRSHFHTFTPKVLKPYIGKNINLYYENIFPEPNEIFRIKPIDFIFNFRTQIYNKETPYFTANSQMVIPKIFIKNYIGKNISHDKICFDNTTTENIKSGNLIVLIKDQSIQDLAYNLDDFICFVRSAKLTKMMDIIKSFNKILINFQYSYFVKECNAIVFKEDINAE